MNRPMKAEENLARRILAWEADESDPSQAYAASRAVENMRLHLTRFIGSAGFQALLARALSLAKAQVPTLASVQVNADGTVTGLAAALMHDVDAAGEGALVLLAQLLELLVTFVGETMTLQIVRDVWSEAHLHDLHFSAEETMG